MSPKERASVYCQQRGFEPIFGNILGTGQEGSVWPTDNKTAIKVFDRQRNYNSELGCYQRLSELGISELEGFTIPHLIDSDSELLIVEMTIVAPPFVLDFGKAYLDHRPDFSAEIMADYDVERREMFEGNWDLVESAVRELEQFGIYYWDARPGNIDCRKHPLAVFA